MDTPVRSVDIVASLRSAATANALDAIRRRVPAGQEVFGLRMGTLFDIARRNQDATLEVVSELLDHPAYEPRLAGLCILDFQVRHRLDDAARHARYALYLCRHDRITSWDMVDRAAPRVVGGYLAGRDLTPLHDLAAAADTLRRRTAITAPLFFTRAGSSDDLAGGFRVAETLARDPEPVVHNAVGIFLKHAGVRAPDRLRAFLNDHAPGMPRPALRLAIEKLPASERSAILSA